MIKCKKMLPVAHATETDTFANGAYITDPFALCLSCVRSLPS